MDHEYSDFMGKVTAVTNKIVSLNEISEKKEIDQEIRIR